MFECVIPKIIMSNLESEIQYISDTCRIFLTVAIGGSRDETREALKELPITNAVDYLPKYLPIRRQIRLHLHNYDRIKSAAAASTAMIHSASSGPVIRPFILDEFHIRLLRSPKDHVIKSLLSDFQRRVDSTSERGKILRGVIPLGAALLYCVLLGCRYVQDGVSLATLFLDFIPAWSERIASDCGVCMYKVWQLVRLDLETFIYLMASSETRLMHLNHSRDQPDQSSKDGVTNGE